MGGIIFGMIISIIMIIGGLSGELVLIGTNSSIALVVVGFIFLIYDIIRLAAYIDESSANAKRRITQTGENFVDLTPYETSPTTEAERYDGFYETYSEENYTANYDESTYDKRKNRDTMDDIL